MVLLNPIVARRFQQAQLERTKTDAIDAAALARFAFEKRPAPSYIHDAATDALWELVRHRDRLQQDFEDRVLQLHRLVDLGFTGPTISILRRVRPRDQDEWIMIADIPERIEVSLADLVIMADDARRFEADCDLLRRPASHIGSTARYDWEGMYITLMVRIHDQGLPATQAE